MIIMETAFGNTPLQGYNLSINRFIFLIELIIFILFIFLEKYERKRFST